MDREIHDYGSFRKTLAVAVGKYNLKKKQKSHMTFGYDCTERHIPFVYIAFAWKPSQAF
jgi:hypothetical protein